MRKVESEPVQDNRHVEEIKQHQILPNLKMAQEYGIYCYRGSDGSYWEMDS